jgi:ParB/RepB/Spo0J family partition protein
MELQDARNLPLSLIDPNQHQSRQAFDIEGLQELASTMRDYGVLEPIIVRPVEGRYEIVAGERRYRAALIAELDVIPAIIRHLDDQQAAIVTALENLQREDLDIEDEARQFDYLCNALDVSQRELARMLGKDHGYISRRIRLLKRPDLMAAYRAGMLVFHEATALTGSAETEVDQDAESVSQGHTLPGSEERGEGDIELVEREDLPGYLVKRGGAPASGSTSPGVSQGHKSSRPLFRWRPLQQFQNWVGRMKPEEVPVDERASVKAQVVEIKALLEQLERALEEIETPSGP